MLPKEISDQIIEALKPVDPYRVILFGSYAWGIPEKESDIDLYIITRDEFLPQNWSEKMDIKLKVAKSLRNLKKKYDIDLIVHTKEMSNLFFKTKGNFPEEVRDKGIVLL
jgi:predicted nucleotidyltransferase